MKNTNLSLTKLVITGNFYITNDEDIRQKILTLEPIGTFLTQDINIIQQTMQHLPWIKHVSVRKKWPNELKIHLIEHLPIARWNDSYMLDNNGKIFKVPDNRLFKQFITLYGPKDSQYILLNGYYIMNKELTTFKNLIKSISMNNRYSWHVILKNNIKLELGREKIIQRLQRFIKVYPIFLQKNQQNNHNINCIDLRYKLGIAVSWIPAYNQPVNK